MNRFWKSVIWFVPVAFCSVVAIDAFYRSRIDPRAVIDKAIDAHGGAFELARCKTGVLQGVRYVYQPVPRKLIFEVTFDHPRRLKHKMRVEKNDTFNWAAAFVVIDGEYWGWEKVRDEIKPYEGDTGYPGVTEFFRLLELRGEEFQLLLLPEQQIHGRPAVGVKVLKESEWIEHYFDRAEGWRVKSTIPLSTLTENSGRKVILELYFTDYKKVGGVRFPMQFTTLRNGKKYADTYVTELRFLDHLDDKMFDLDEVEFMRFSQ